jgi:mono/diheme cytochrome c family protein
MAQMRNVKTLVRNMVCFVAVAVFAAGVAIGQSGKQMGFEVPYAFHVGSKAMPAGTYKFSLSERGTGRVQVQPEKGGAVWANVVAPLKAQTELFPGGYLVFDKSASGLRLSEVWMQGIDGVLLHAIPNGHERMILVSGARFDPNRAYNGKTVYNMTCAKCHGEDGKGNEGADKFFNTKIPHLASQQIQGLPDEAFKTQIEMGNGKMPPVEVNEGGFQHRLPSQYVDDVIAYVRTLKE